MRPELRFSRATDKAEATPYAGLVALPFQGAVAQDQDGAVPTAQASLAFSEGPPPPRVTLALVGTGGQAVSVHSGFAAGL